MNVGNELRAVKEKLNELWKLVISMRASGGGGGGTHNLLSNTHPDTTTAAPTRGDIITAQGAPALWKRLAKSAAGLLLGYDANDVVAINPNTLDVDKVDGMDAADFQAAGTVAAHHATHEKTAGTDKIKLDDLDDPDDNTDLDASTSKHGLLKKLPGGTTNFLRADGAFSAPPGTATDCFKPPDFPRRWLGFSQANVGGYVMGAAAGVSSSGTLGDAGDTYGPFRRHTCGTVTAGAFYTSSAHIRQYWDPTVWMRMRTDEAIANIRLWAGLVDNAATFNADNPASRNLAMFRYSDGVSGNWYFCMKDGTTLNAVDTGLAVAVDTIYDMKINLSGGVAYWEITPFGGATVSGNSNSNLPNTATNLYMGFWGWATSGTVYYKSLYAYCEID